MTKTERIHTEYNQKLSLLPKQHLLTDAERAHLFQVVEDFSLLLCANHPCLLSRRAASRFVSVELTSVNARSSITIQKSGLSAMGMW